MSIFQRGTTRTDEPRLPVYPSPIDPVSPEAPVEVEEVEVAPPLAALSKEKLLAIIEGHGVTGYSMANGKDELLSVVQLLEQEAE